LSWKWTASPERRSRPVVLAEVLTAVERVELLDAGTRGADSRADQGR
jgi:hypothetical protein